MKTAKLIKCVGRMESVTTYEGETIEAKVNRIVNNGEPITDGTPIIYTERKDGVLPEYDIRTDRWDIAIDAGHRLGHHPPDLQGGYYRG